MSWIFFSQADYHESNRLKRRSFIIKEILKKHQKSTFESKRCLLSCPEYASYIKITLVWKVDAAPGQARAPAQARARAQAQAARGEAVEPTRRPARPRASSFGPVVPERPAPVNTHARPSLRVPTAIITRSDRVIPFDTIQIKLQRPRTGHQRLQPEKTETVPLKQDHREDVRIQEPEEQPL